MGSRLMMTRLGLAFLALAIFGMAMGARPANAAITTVKMNLAGPAISGAVPVGWMTYTTDGTYKTLTLSVFRVKLAANTVLTARAGTTVLGTLKIKINGGGANFSKDTRNGDAIPAITAATAITVKKADGTLVVGGPPTSPRDFSMTASLTGPKISGKAPAGSLTYKETDYGYTRSLRMLAFSINLVGSKLDLYLNANLLGSCTVSSGKICIITETLLDSESVQHLTTSSVLKLKKNVGGAVVMTSQAWKTQ